MTLDQPRARVSRHSGGQPTLDTLESIPLSDLRRASAVDRRSASRLAGERARYAILFALGAFLSGISILQGINPHDRA